MRYMGSKKLLAKHILPIMLKGREVDQTYVEPFVGGCNTFECVDNPRIAADINPFMIAMYNALLLGWAPPSTISADEYKVIKSDSDINPALHGYACSQLTFGSKWRDSYVSYEQRDRNKRSHLDTTAYHKALKLIPRIKGASFIHSDYRSLYIPPQSIIYCDPPYKNTTGYGSSIDHDEFWDWCRRKVEEGHEVFVSELLAPDDFTCVWQQEVKSPMNRNTRTPRLEKLFVHNTQLRD